MNNNTEIRTDILKRVEQKKLIEPFVEALVKVIEPDADIFISTIELDQYTGDSWRFIFNLIAVSDETIIKIVKQIESFE